MKRPVTAKEFGGSEAAGTAREPASPLDVAVGDGGIHHGAQLAAHRIGVRRQHLGHENGDQLFRRINPERRRCRAAPGVFAGAAGNQGLRGVYRDGKAETESDAVELSQLGCEFAQGFAFGQPLSAADARRLMGAEAG